MIAKIIYGETVKGTIEYVTNKKDSKILGFNNTYSDDETDLKDFQNILEHQSNRTKSKNKFAHISLNLSPEDNLTDEDFLELSKEFMDEMGYEDQPVLIVKHNDRSHSHVHIITTNIKNDGSKVNLHNSGRNAMKINRSLEVKYGLKELSLKRKHNTPKIYRKSNQIEELNFNDDTQTRNYIKHHINAIVQQFNIVDLKQFSHQLSKRSINVKITESKGVKFQVSDNNYESGFINGSRVYSEFSLPKLSDSFDKNKKNKKRRIVKSTLKRQISNLFDKYQILNVEDLKLIFEKNYPGKELELNYSDSKNLLGYTIYDSSGYIFKASEVDRSFSIRNNKNPLNLSEKTRLNYNSKQFRSSIQNNVQKGIKKEYYSNSKKFQLYSSFLSDLSKESIKENLIINITKEVGEELLEEDKKMLIQEINVYIDGYLDNENIKKIEERELFTLSKKVDLIEKIQSNNLDFKYVADSVGVKIIKNKAYYKKSNKHSVEHSGKLKKSSFKTNAKSSSGFENQNQIVLNYLYNNGKSQFINSSAIFLPFIYPDLYNNIEIDKRREFEKVVTLKYLENYLNEDNYSERSPIELVEKMNKRGLLISKKKDQYFINSILHEKESKIILNNNLSKYFDSDLSGSLLINQKDNLVEVSNNKENLYKKLWLTNLIDKGIYDKAAWMMVNENIDPMIEESELKIHLDKGLLNEINKVKQTRGKNVEQKRSSLYTLKSLLEGKSYKKEEVYNGFKDELTDYSKYNNLGI